LFGDNPCICGSFGRLLARGICCFGVFGSLRYSCGLCTLSLRNLGFFGFLCKLGGDAGLFGCLGLFRGFCLFCRLCALDSEPGLFF